MQFNSLPIMFLDLQTTGANANNSYILEMAYSSINEETQSFLIQSPPDYELPKRIQIITGVKPEDMKEAIAFPEAMKRLIAFVKHISKNCIYNDELPICVIHFSQFEKPFLEAAFKSIQSDIPFRIIDTHDIAKRLLPNLPTRGIKGLAGYFSYDAGELKRSTSHVNATKVIWTHLIESLAQKDIVSLHDLQQWLIETPRAKKTKYEYPLSKEKRLNLPISPGIYRMLNSDGIVLYVGKASSLRDRVNSYFRGQKNRDAKKLEMLTQVHDLRVTVCATPLEAALMETDEIKKLNPRYNISLKKDRRSLAFFNHNFTSVQNTVDHEHYIGPFSHAVVFESMIKLSQYLTINYSEGLLPDENLFFHSIDSQIIKEGFEIFCLRHHFNPLQFISIRSMVAIGIIWQRRFEKEEQLEYSGAELEDEVEELVSNDILTSIDLADKFERHFRRIGVAFMRVRKINRMLNADIQYQIIDQAKRSLQVRNGFIYYLPEESENKFINSWEKHSVDTYDRMSVLLSELERIRSKKGHYQIFYKN